MLCFIDFRDTLYAYIVLTDCENHTDVELKKPADYETGNQETSRLSCDNTTRQP